MAEPSGRLHANAGPGSGRSRERFDRPLAPDMGRRCLSGRLEPRGETTGPSRSSDIDSAPMQDIQKVLAVACSRFTFHFSGRNVG